MTKDLTGSTVARQNILNNSYAVQEIQNAIGITGILFEGEYKFLKRQVAEFFEVTERTIDNCLEKNEKELSKNGYETVKGKRLIDMKLILQYRYDHEIDFATKTSILGVFNFRAFLNIAMLLTDSEKARIKMASRDLCFRDALHKNLEEYN